MCGFLKKALNVGLLGRGSLLWIVYGLQTGLPLGRFTSSGLHTSETFLLYGGLFIRTLNSIKCFIICFVVSI